MDADLQDSRKRIPVYILWLLLKTMTSGWKKKRYDSVVAKTFRLNYLMGNRKHLEYN
jgi:hypothetical protein